MTKTPSRPFAATAAALVLVAGCAQDDPRTVQWYRAHPHERGQLLAECELTPELLKEEPNCIAAGEATRQNWAVDHRPG